MNLIDKINEKLNNEVIEEGKYRVKFYKQGEQLGASDQAEGSFDNELASRIADYIKIGEVIRIPRIDSMKLANKATGIDGGEMTFTKWNYVANK